MIQYYTKCDCDRVVFIVNADASNLYSWFITSIMDHITQCNHEVIVKARVI